MGKAIRGMLALWLAAPALAAVPALAGETQPDPAYLECYRQVLGDARYKDASAEELDRQRMAIGMDVVNKCGDKLTALRSQARKSVKKSESIGMEMGGTSLGHGMAMAFTDITMAGTIGGDLDLVDPRVAALSDARLTERARKLLALPAGDPAALPSGFDRKDPVVRTGAYGDCLERAGAELSLGSKSEQALFADAKRRCAPIRKASEVKGFMASMVKTMLDGEDERTARDFPRLMRRLRELRAAEGAAPKAS